MAIRIFNTTQKSVLATNAVIADTSAARMTGLLKHESLAPGEALVITHCNSIHMFFMKFAIDVIFVDGENRVVGLVPAIKPFGLSPIFWKARLAIEVNTGTIVQSRTSIGDQLDIS